MKRFIFTLASVICLLVMGHNMAAAVDSLFYYSGGSEIYLQIDTTRLLLKFDGIPPDQGFNYIKSSYPEMEFVTHPTGGWSRYRTRPMIHE